MNIREIVDLLIDNEIEASKVINLVPSENFSSAFARLPLISDVNNRYFFNDSHDPKQWNFKGAKEVATIETEVAIPLLKELSGAKYVNVRPVSGLSAMQLVLKSFGDFLGKKVLVVSPDLGGHYATKVVAEGFGLEVDFITGLDSHQIDIESFEKKLLNQSIDFIYIDQSNCLFPIDIKQISDIVKKISPNTILHVDSSHWMGLIFGEVMDNPLQCGADSFGGSTHKTFPGPQKAVFCTNNRKLSEQVKETQFNMISSHHFGSVSSLALALTEFKYYGGKQYASNVKQNSKIMAEELYLCGFDVKGKKYGFTSGHQIWFSTNNIGINSFIAAERLYEVGIRVNVFNELPGCSEDIIRLGTNEITRHGASNGDISELVNIMEAAIKQTQSINILKKKVEDIRKRRSFNYGISLTEGELFEKSLNLLKIALTQ